MDIRANSLPAAHRRPIAGAALLAVGVVVALAGLGFAASAGADPEGNNGTIKIDGVALEGGQANEPHVRCSFAIEFFGYDEGDLEASVTFALQLPTVRPSGTQLLLTDKLAIGEDPAGGATDLDAAKEYQLDFTGVTADPEQGYHVKVSVHAEGSRGADTKHKVFWVLPCPPPATTTTTTTTTSTTSTTTTSTTTTSTTVTTTTAATPTTASTATTDPSNTESTAPSTTETTAGVLGAQETTTTLPETVVLGKQLERPTVLPRTGVGTGALGFLGGLALGLGGLIMLLTGVDRKAS